MVPTEEALVLAAATDRAWELIAGATQALEREPAATPLRVLAPSTFAMRWLIPRVWSFSEAHDEIELQVRQTDSLEAWEEIPFDVAIRTDPNLPGHLTGTPFLSEKLILAAAPRLARQLRTPADLSRAPILRSATRPGQLKAWLTAAGLALPAHRPTTFPHFYLALEAALAGAGVLVCPLETIGDLLAKGELKEPWPGIRVTGPTYVALYDDASPRAAPARTFVDWLAIARRCPAPMPEAA